MWVAQTYLGNLESNANLFAYYLSTGSKREGHFSSLLQTELGRIGAAYGDKVSILVPNAEYADKIENEVRQHMDLWLALEEDLPGVFVSPRPLAQWKKEHTDNIFIPLDTTDPEGAAALVLRLRRHADTAIRSKATISTKTGRVRKAVWDSIELKPGIFGLRIDLKKLFSP